MSGRPLRVALIGLGRVAWRLELDQLRNHPCTHLGAWLATPGVEVVAAADCDEEARQQFSEHYPSIRLYSDYSTLLDRERPDLVSLCGYATERCEMVVAACNAGVRGIWCEKAIAASTAECDAIRGAVEEHGVVCAVSFMRRWEKRYRQIGRMLELGAIGAVESINIHFSGNMLHTGTHAFDLLHAWCGPVSSVRAWLDPAPAADPEAQSGYRYSQKNSVEDRGGFALLEMANGLRATVHGGDKGYFRFEFEILGSGGMIRVGNSQNEWWRIAESTRYSGFAELERQPLPAGQKGEEGNIWLAAASDLVTAINNGGTTRCGVTEGCHALEIALAMHESDHHGHAPIDPATLSGNLYVASR